MLEKGNRKIINGWAFYDWANSVYPLVINTAIFPIYYDSVTRSESTDIVALFGLEFSNSALYSYTLALSYLIIAALSPFLSGIADYSGNKKSFMRLFCYLGAVACAGLFFFTKEYLGFGLLMVMLASIGYSGSIVFYNAFLPEIAHPKDHDKISAKGFSLGYVGSALLLIFNLSMVMFPEIYGIDNAGTASKIAFLTVGVWWVGFSQITFNRLPDNVYERKAKGNKFTKGFEELKKVWGELNALPRLKRYLLAFFLFNMGVQTVMLMATLFGKKEINMETAQLITTILIIQFVAIVGAYLFSFLSGKLGNIRALSISILIWIGVCIGAYFIYTPGQFYVIAAVVGFVMGGIQSLSRSTYSKLLPDTVDHASYFSFYDVCEKLSIVIGMVAYGFIDELTGDMRSSSIALMIFFIGGLIVLLMVPKEKSLMPEDKQ